MEISSSQLLADRDQMFDDWGETITYRKVSQAFDTTTGEITETYTDSSLTVIVGTEPRPVTKDVASQHLSQHLHIQAKAEEVPTNEPTPGSRILHESIEYEIINTTLSAARLVRTFECRLWK